MGPTPRIEYRELHLRVRPARLAIWTDADSPTWIEDLERLVECMSTTWGGSTALIVPGSTDGTINESMWPLICLHDPDQWGLVRRTARGLKMSDLSRFDEWLEERSTYLSDDGSVTVDEARAHLQRDHSLDENIAETKLPSALVERILRWTGPSTGVREGRLESVVFEPDGLAPRMLTDVRRMRPLAEKVTVCDLSQLPPPLRLHFRLRLGGLGPRQMEALEALGVEVDVVEATIDDIDQLFDMTTSYWERGGAIDLGHPPGRLPREVVTQAPLKLAKVGTAEVTRTGADLRPMIVVVLGDTIHDLAFSQALDSVGVPSVWLHSSMTDPDQIGGEQGLSWVRSVLRTKVRHDPEPDEIVLWSCSLDDADLAAARSTITPPDWPDDMRLRLAPPTLPSRRQSLVVDPQLYGDIVHEAFIDGTMARAMPPLLPSAVEHLHDNWDVTWWIDVEVPDHRMPARTALHPIDPPPGRYPTVIARSGASSIAYFSHTMGFASSAAPLEHIVERPRPRMLSASEIFTQLLADIGATYELSDAGRFRSLATAHWADSRTFAADLNDPRRRTLLEGWLPSGTKEDERPGGTLAGRRYMTFDDCLEMCGIEEGPLRELLDAYVDRGTLRRGFALQCRHCRYLDWLPAEAVGQRFECARCQTSQAVTMDTWKWGNEPPVAYDLAEVVYQALRGNTRVPVCASALLASKARSYDELPDIDIFKGDEKVCELDIAAISDGSIFIGEAKIGDALGGTTKEEGRKLTKIVEAADLLTADVAVFATASDAWRDETKARIEQAFRRSSTEVLFLEGV